MIRKPSGRTLSSLVDPSNPLETVSIGIRLDAYGIADGATADTVTGFAVNFVLGTYVGAPAH